MYDGSDDSESDSAGGSAESGSQISEAHLETRTVNHETVVKCGVDRCVSTDVSTERPKVPEQNSDLTSGLRKTREEDRQKGRAISRQIASHFPLA